MGVAPDYLLLVALLCLVGVMTVLIFAIYILLFFLVLALRRVNILRGMPYIYNFAMVLIYVAVTLVFIPAFDVASLKIASFGEEYFDLIREIKLDLSEFSLEMGRVRSVMAAYTFTLFWFPLSLVVISGLAIGFGDVEVKVLKRTDEERGEIPWFGIVLGIFMIVVISVVLGPSYFSSPVEEFGERCGRSCNGLQFGVFPYFANQAMTLFVLNMLLYIVSVAIAGKLKGVIRWRIN